MTTGQTIAIVASGFIGAMAYTFSDTFWFSAVEGEVYATSSLMTAIVFWAILKWGKCSRRTTCKPLADFYFLYNWPFYWCSPFELTGYSGNCICILFQKI